MAGIVIRAATTIELIDLRHAVLRPGFGRETVIFRGDDEPTSYHFGAFDDGRNVCCVSFHLDQYKGRPAFQLRGMATAPACRGRGLGRDLLAFAQETIVAKSPIRDFWCNARTSAVGFYEKQGWHIDSDEFTIEPSGPHYRMIKQL